MVTLLFFGRLADIAGHPEHLIPLSPSVTTLFQLIAQLSSVDPALGDALNGPKVHVAVNKTIVPLGTDASVSDGDEIAFMPPLSGG